MIAAAGPATGAAAQTDSAPEHLHQLNTCREGILDPEARPEERQRWTELLFSYDTPDAHALIVELLELTDRPDVQRSVCEVLRDVVRANPAKLDVGYVNALISLLGAESAELRAASARALAELRAADVPARLGAIAADVDAPLEQRLSAINALAPNTHQREVIRPLIKLLDAADPSVVERATVALGPAAMETFGSNVARWKTWWAEQSQLSEEQWLAGQVRIYRERNRRLNEQFEAYRQRTAAEQTAATSQLRAFQRDLFRALPVEQRNDRLIEWLESPLSVVQGTALAIITARIADEGKRPDGEVLAALLRMLADVSPATRREVLLIIQNLNDPSVIDAVLARLRTEADHETRLALFATIGRLGSPRAVPDLLRELRSANAKPEYIREAATALGEIARKAERQSDISAVLNEAVSPLKQRYQSAPPGDTALRSALLAAMAGVKDKAFVTEFLDAVDTDDPTVLRPAIRGLRDLGDRTKLSRFRMLMQHGDPQVRLVATEAVGALGKEDADLEGLQSRLNPAIEPNDLVREAAWRGFRDFLARQRSLPERIAAADRLRDLPEFEVAYLKELAQALPAANGGPTHLGALYDRLGAMLYGQQKYGDALGPLKQLYELRSERNDPEAFEVGLRWLRAALRSPALQDVAEAMTELCDRTNDTKQKDQIIATVAAYLDTPAVAADDERMRASLAVLRGAATESLGGAWTELLDRAATRTEPSSRPP
jgi:HEAT repeat protein